VTRQRFATIIEGKAIFYLTTLIELLKDPEFKKAIINLKYTKFLPDNDKGGAFFDGFTAFGLFVRASILGQRVSGHVYQ
jgi:hypothetical protein